MASLVDCTKVFSLFSGGISSTLPLNEIRELVAEGAHNLAGIAVPTVLNAAIEMNRALTRVQFEREKQRSACF